MKIRKADRQDLPAITRLALALWPEHTPADLEADLTGLLEEGAAFFLAFRQDRAVGFAQCQLRRDYVEGTQSSPVGYLEGIYVIPECRRMGISRELLRACEQWAREMGCTEFASDCELGNTASEVFHKAVGFREANRIICFTKKLT